MTKHLAIGITEGGVLHRDTDPPLSLEDKFRMVRDAGVYEYYDIRSASGSCDGSALSGQSNTRPQCKVLFRAAQSALRIDGDRAKHISSEARTSMLTSS